MDCQQGVAKDVMLRMLCAVHCEREERFSPSFQNLNLGGGDQRSCRGHAPFIRKLPEATALFANSRNGNVRVHFKPNLLI